MRSKRFFYLLVLLLTRPGFAQDAPGVESRRPGQIVPPADYSAAVAAGTRSASGSPGPAYWQQRVRYDIRAELDPTSTELRGSETIVYYNRSPGELRTIVLNLYQNVFGDGVPRNRYVTETGGISLHRVAAAGEALALRPVSQIPVVATPRSDAMVGYAVQGTLARLVLPTPLAAGDSIRLEIDWTHRVPAAPSFRTGWEDALGGRAFQVAQWYPQVAVFDDIDGWDATPYLGDGEFYLEYGDFDVAITVPEGFLVGATGTLLNADEVLPPAVRTRLAASLRSDSTTHVVTLADLDAGRATADAPDGKLTWRFRASDVRDFAFATSSRYLWDATRVSVSTENGAPRTIPVNALYRPGAPNWTSAARYGQHSIDVLDGILTPFPFPGMTIAEGPIGGMEYPGMVFIGRPTTVEALYGVIAHEAGAHQWFPMAVGQNEAAYAWMDEGLTTYYEAVAFNDFFRTDTAHRGDLASYLAVAGRENEVPLARHTDLVTPYGARVVAAYTKPGILLRALRSIMGDSIFDASMRGYAREWALKHPTPWDFFQFMEHAHGRDLDWFFQPWWYGTGVLDQAIERVESLPEGVRVTVRDRGVIAMPTRIVASNPDGRSSAVEVAVDHWLAGARTASVVIPLPGASRVEIDPAGHFPDVDRANNLWAR